MSNHSLGSGINFDYSPGSFLPVVHLNCYDEITRKGARVYGDSGNSYESTIGKVRDYTAEGNVVPERFKSYSEIPIDPSIVTAANGQGMTTEEFFEILDPKSNYKEGDPLAEYTALDRQFIRYGYIAPKSNLLSPKMKVPMEYTIANTPANNVLMPAYTRTRLFFSEIRDLDLDPSLLVATTRRQKENYISTMSVEDNLTPHSRLHIISEAVTPPSIRLGLSAYKSGFITHGISFTYTRDFARDITLDLFKQALRRAAMKERVALFVHILDTIRSGYSVYGLSSGVSSTTAISLDAVGVTGAGIVSFIAVMLMMYNMRPYKPEYLVMNINTYIAYLQATVPSNIQESTILSTLSKLKVPNIANPVKTVKNWFIDRPDVLVVPDYALPVNKIIFIDPANGLERVIKQGSELNELGYTVRTRTFDQVVTVTDGLAPYPQYKDAVKILSLTT